MNVHHETEETEETEEKRGFISFYFRSRFYLFLFLIWTFGAYHAMSSNRDDTNKGMLSTINNNDSGMPPIPNGNADTTLNGKPTFINYKDIPHADPSSNSTPNEKANDHQSGCNTENQCRQGDGAKKDGKKN
ncbi:uncharacterized protein LOC111292706 [Durio zibethinus]|uniref:Uncharacterized protein LOC111292706 n=1 Tax=Durio zibethinus TaxID=66656 RepID=A0A6P5YKA8_DURZI|nr:uncharacterized protein LOC111292706 [Durio zibethinus]